jgi:hypothetical protein
MCGKFSGPYRDRDLRLRSGFPFVVYAARSESTPIRKMVCQYRSFIGTSIAPIPPGLKVFHNPKASSRRTRRARACSFCQGGMSPGKVRHRLLFIAYRHSASTSPQDWFLQRIPWLLGIIYDLPATDDHCPGADSNSDPSLKHRHKCAPPTLRLSHPRWDWMPIKSGHHSHFLHLRSEVDWFRTEVGRFSTKE